MNTPQLTQNCKTGSYCLWDVRPHWHISVHVNAEVADNGNWHDLVGAHSDGWHVVSRWRRRLDVDQRTSIFAVFSWSRLERIHLAKSAMQVEMMFWSSSVADGRQSPLDLGVICIQMRVETMASRQYQDNMFESAASVMRMSTDDDDQADQQHELADH